MKNNKNIRTIGGTMDYIKAVKKADREINMGNGFVSVHKIFKNKKAYDRKRDKNINM